MSVQSKKQYLIPDGSVWASAWKMTAVLAAVGSLVALAGAVMQPERFAFSYLFGFITVLTLWLGSVFFVLIQHLTGAGWSVTVRRTAEFFVSAAWVLPVLFAPMALNFETLYPWWGHDDHGVAHAQEHAAPEAAAAQGDAHAGHGQAAAGDAHGVAAAEHGGGHGAHEAHHLIEQELLRKKSGYLNQTFFFIRMLVYFAIWFWIGSRLFGYSVAQDATGDKSYTVKLQRFVAPATFLFALSLTFAGFDWVMSLEPAWYSTMFGVRVFSSSVVTSFAVIIVVTLGLKRAGLIGDEINTEHYHDLGKLMFGFLIFWAYISFSEFFLIWYAAIPEETTYFHKRWDQDSWRTISIMIVTLKFIVPFYVTMSRNAKRNNAAIGFAAGWLLAMHLVEIYYWIMPYYRPNEPVQWSGVWMELGCVMATVGFFLTVVFRRMRKHSLIAVGDPRLPRALQFVNL